MSKQQTKVRKGDIPLMIRITPDMKAILERLAAVEDRSISSQVVHMLKTGRTVKQRSPRDFP